LNDAAVEQTWNIRGPNSRGKLALWISNSQILMANLLSRYWTAKFPQRICSPDFKRLNSRGKLALRISNNQILTAHLLSGFQTVKFPRRICSPDFKQLKISW